MTLLNSRKGGLVLSTSSEYSNPLRGQNRQPSGGSIAWLYHLRESRALQLIVRSGTGMAVSMPWCMDGLGLNKSQRRCQFYNAP